MYLYKCLHIPPEYFHTKGSVNETKYHCRYFSVFLNQKPDINFKKFVYRKTHKKLKIPVTFFFSKMICENVELDLLKDPRFVSTLVGLGFAFVSDVTYLAMEPMLLFSYGFSKVPKILHLF